MFPADIAFSYNHLVLALKSFIYIKFDKIPLPIDFQHFVYQLLDKEIYVDGSRKCSLLSKLRCKDTCFIKNLIVLRNSNV